MSLHKKAAAIAKTIGEAKKNGTNKKDSSKADTKSKDKVKATYEQSYLEVNDAALRGQLTVNERTWNQLNGRRLWTGC